MNLAKYHEGLREDLKAELEAEREKVLALEGEVEELSVENKKLRAHVGVGSLEQRRLKIPQDGAGKQS